MTDAIRVEAGELTSEEVIDALKAGERVIIETSIAGLTLDMTVRKREGTYYCDTPVKLLTYETDEEMRECLERYRLATVEE